MNPRQREYFRQKLERWKSEILAESRETLENLQEESQNHPDMADRASSESDRALELRTRDRQRKLISKIDAALKRIEDGTYGYCEETGDPIGIASSTPGRSPRSRWKPRKCMSGARRCTATNKSPASTQTSSKGSAWRGPFFVCRDQPRADLNGG